MSLRLIPVIIELLSRLQSSLDQQEPPAFTNLDNLYQEAGKHRYIVRRFEDVQVFHEKIVANRKAHLQAETHSVAERIEHRDREKADLDMRRAEIMQILKTGGALEQFTGLQGEYSKMQAEVETLRKTLVLLNRLREIRRHSRLKEPSYTEGFRMIIMNVMRF